MIKSTALHVWSEYSIGEGISPVKDLVQFEKECGAKAVALTDLGVGAGLVELYDLCKENGIKPILGAELFLKNDRKNKKESPRTLCAYAVDYTGYQGLCNALTQSYEAREETGHPCLSVKALSSLFGEGKRFFGHVLFTTSGLDGVASHVFLDNESVKNAAKEKRECAAKIALPDGYLNACKKKEELEAILAGLNAKKKQLSSVASQKYERAEKRAKSMEDETVRKNLLAAIEVQKRESREAGENLKVIKGKIEEVSLQLKPLQGVLKEGEKKKKKIDGILKEAQALERLQKSEETMINEAKRELNRYGKLLGKENLYAEVQFHGLTEEKSCYPLLAKAASQAGIKLVAGQGAVACRKEELSARELLCNIKNLSESHPIWESQKERAQAYLILPDDLLMESLGQILSGEELTQAMESVEEITTRCNVTIPDTFYFPKVESAKEKLHALCEQGKKTVFPQGYPDESVYTKRLEYELQAIDHAGLSDIFVLAAENIRYVKEKADNQMYVGPGRGSAGGSLVSCLLGITQGIDPVSYGLSFERFFHPDRVSMPDIDTDFSGEGRGIALSHLKETYGEENVCGILSVTRMGTADALSLAGKLYALQQGKKKTAYAETVSSIRAALSSDETVSSGKVRLLSRFSKDADACQILSFAEQLEGRIRGFGTHAAGVIIGDGLTPLCDLVPLIKTEGEKGQRLISCDMVRAESVLHLLKMDFLGLKQLDAISATMQAVTKNHGVKLDVFHLPFEGDVFEGIYAKGFTNFIFQAESDGMKQISQKIRPSCFEDVVLLVAAYRPGPMQYLDEIAAVKGGKKQVNYLVPQLEDLLKDTYGCVLYQEQVMEICVKLAGYNMAQADFVRRCMSKKQDLESERKCFVYGDEVKGIDGCIRRGIKEDLALQLFDELVFFARYAFNRSHAVFYAYLSYVTAYLKYHYPEEYLAASIGVYGQKKEQLQCDCKKLGIRIEGPDINRSEAETISTKKGEILCGISAILHVGSKAKEIVEERKKAGAYLSVEDFLSRVKPQQKVRTAIFLSGAADHLIGSRKDAVTYADTYLEAYETCCDLKAALSSGTLTDGERKKEAAKLQAAEDYLAGITMPINPKEDLLTLLEYEKTYLGFWTSADPFAAYCDLDSYGCIPIGKGLSGTVTIAGYVSSFSIKETKGKERATFTITDKTGSIRVSCFGRQLKQAKDILKEGEIFVLSGKVQDCHGKPNVVLSTLIPAAKREETVYLLVQSNDIVETVDELLPLLSSYRVDEGGVAFLLYDKQLRSLQKGTFQVSAEITRRRNFVTEYVKEDSSLPLHAPRLIYGRGTWKRS